MDRISKKSCSYFYDDKYESWGQLCKNFRWELPEKMNAAYYVCDVHADDKHAVAIFHEDHRGQKGQITFLELKNITNRLANYLKSKGLRKGDRVAVCLAQRPEAIITHIAVWKAGGISVPLTTLFGPDALLYRLKTSGAGFVITEDSMLDIIRSIRADLNELNHILVVGDTDMKKDEIKFWDSIYGMSVKFDPVVLNPSDNMILIFTGGTTGDPKGVLHRHSFIFKAPGCYGPLFNGEIKPSDVSWTPADYAWAAALFDLVFPALFYGKPVTAYEWGGKFDPEKAFKLIEDYALAVIHVPPTALRMMRMVKNPEERFDLSSVRVIMSGSESLGKSLPEWANTTFGPQTVIHEAYGQTEGIILIGNCRRYFEYKFNIGKAAPGLEIEILDDDGNILPFGKTGEIAVKAFDGNPILFKEYWNDPEATKAKFKRNWMLTGDLGIKDAEGYFTFVSRKDDIIISSGYRIGPSEIEDTLIKHESVAEAAVIGVPDETRGAIPKAFIVLREGHKPSEKLKNRLQDFVKYRLAKHEYPRKIEFMKELPKTTTGKVKRRDLRILEGIDR